ncbi:MAG: hypothetical protein B6D68_01250, partial [spirochete symbiont of Stewartia floridana]
LDDGGSDDTEASLQDCLNRHNGIPVHYRRIPHQGVSAARNIGVSMACGTWIAFLDSDDSWMPDKLQKQVQFTRENPGIRLVYTQERWFRNGRRVNPPAAYRKHSGDVFIHCLPVCMIGVSTVLIAKDLFEQVNGFDTDYPVCEDYDLWLRITSHCKVGLLEEELTCKFGGHDDQLSASFIGIDYWRLRALCGILRDPGLSTVKIKAIHREMERKAGILLHGCRKHGRMKWYEESLAMIKKAWPGYRHGSNSMAP